MMWAFFLPARDAKYIARGRGAFRADRTFLREQLSWVQTLDSDASYRAVPVAHARST